MSLISGRVIRAAAKLALFYSAVVILEIAVLGVADRIDAPTLRDIGEIATWLSIPFAGAFVLLAVARRWGFIALWAILAALWVFVLSASSSWRWPTDYPRIFVPWSIFALPLWVIGHAGLPRTSHRRISPSMAMLICWAVLLFGVQFFGLPRTDFPHPHHIGIADILAWIWAPMPLILSAFAIRHVWRGTAKPIAA